MDVAALSPPCKDLVVCVCMCVSVCVSFGLNNQTSASLCITSFRGKFGVWILHACVRHQAWVFDKSCMYDLHDNACAEHDGLFPRNFWILLCVPWCAQKCFVSLDICNLLLCVNLLLCYLMLANHCIFIAAIAMPSKSAGGPPPQYDGQRQRGPLATLFLTDKAIYFVEESIYNNKYHLCHIPVHPFSQHPKLDNQKLHRTGGAWRWCPWSFQWTKHPTIKTTQIQFPTVQVSHVLFIKCVT